MSEGTTDEIKAFSKLSPTQRRDAAGSDLVAGHCPGMTRGIPFPSIKATTKTVIKSYDPMYRASHDNEPVEAKKVTLEGGFSHRRDIVGKPSQESLHYISLGRGWQWAPKADASQLLACLTKYGWAVTPGRWEGGHKSKKEGKLLEAQYILLDFDENLSWLECIQHEYLNQQALFAYTTTSHQSQGKGDRFRVVFQSDLLITDSQSLDLLIKGLRTKVPGSDPAINSASLLFGNPKAEVHVFNLSNRIPAEQLIIDAVRADEMKRSQFKRPGNRHQSYDLLQSERRVRRWLEYIPNTAYSTWLVVAGCLRAIEAQDHPWAFEAFDAWSAHQYEAYDPIAVDRLWESFDNANPGGFSKLKNLSEWFKANPDKEEYEPSTEEGRSTLHSQQYKTHSSHETNPFELHKRTKSNEGNYSFTDRNS
jgi:hypothetical protein